MTQEAQGHALQLSEAAAWQHIVLRYVTECLWPISECAQDGSLQHLGGELQGH